MPLSASVVTYYSSYYTVLNIPLCESTRPMIRIPAISPIISKAHKVCFNTAQLLGWRFLTWPLSQSGDAWGHVGDGHNVASLRWRGRWGGGGGGAPILDLNREESLHVGVFLSLRDLLLSGSPWGPVFLWFSRGRHIFFSCMPRPAQGALWLAGWREGSVSHSFEEVRCSWALGRSRGVRHWAYTRPGWLVSRCAGGCWCVCKELCSFGEICQARGDPVPQRGLLQSWGVWALAGFCELAHSVSNRVGAAEMLQDGIFLFGRCEQKKLILDKNNEIQRRNSLWDPQV